MHYFVPSYLFSKAIQDEVITDLVSQCKSSQNKLVQLINSTGYVITFSPLIYLDKLKFEKHQFKESWYMSFTTFMWDYCRDEKVLAEALMLNDGIQNVIAKHDAIASGNLPPVPAPVAAPPPVALPPVAPTPVVEETKHEEDEDDEFAQIAQRWS